MRLTKIVLCSSILLAPLSAEASGVLIGPLWMDGVSAREFPNDFVDDPQGRWIRVRFSAKGTGRLIVFTAPVALVDYPTTERVLAQAKGQGIGVIVDGHLDRLDVTARTYHSAQGNKLWIEPGKLLATLGQVTSGLQRIGGGTMDLAGAKLYVRNVTAFKSEASGLRGTFELEAWGRTLSQARLELAGGAQATTTLAQDPSRNTVLRVDMASGAAVLWSAALGARGVQLGGPGLDVGRAHLRETELLVTNLEVRASAGVVTARLEGATGTAEGVELDEAAYEFEAGRSVVGWAAGASAGSHDLAAIRLGATDVGGGTLSSERGRLRRAGTDLVVGRVDGRELSVSMAALQGRFEWSSPVAPALEFLVPPGALDRLALSLVGTWGQSFKVGGRADAAAFIVGGLQLAQALSLGFPPTPASSEVTLPIAVDVPAASGQVTVSDGTGSAMLTGELRRLALKGRLVIPLEAPELARLEIPARQLAVAVAAAVATTPWLDSTKPLFAGAALALSNPVDLRISAAKRQGLVLVEASAVALGDPVLKVEGEEPFQARLDLRASAGATFGYCLDTSRMGLLRGDFRAAGAEFTAIDKGAVAQLGGVAITDPAGRIEDLRLQVDRLSGVGAMSSGPVSLGGSRLSRAPDPRRPGDLAFDGTPAGRFTVSALNGVARFKGQEIELTSVRADNPSAALVDAQLAVGQAVALKSAGFSISGEAVEAAVEAAGTDSDVPRPVPGSPLTLAEVCQEEQADAPTVTRQYFKNVRLQATGEMSLHGAVSEGVEAHLVNSPRITLDLSGLTGRSDRLDGQGTGSFTGLAGTIKSAITTKADCEGGGLLRIPPDTHLATGGADLRVDYQRGEAALRGSLQAFVMEMNSTAFAECHGPWQKHVLVPKREGWTEGICPTWQEPLRRCRWTWETPEVAVEFRTKAVIRALTVTLAMTEPYFESRKDQSLVCNVGPATVITPAIVGGYYPEFRGGLQPVIDVINALVGLVAEVVESGIATVLAQGIAGLATMVLNRPEQQLLCILAAQRGAQ